MSSASKSRVKTSSAKVNATIMVAEEEIVDVPDVSDEEPAIQVIAPTPVPALALAPKKPRASRAKVVKSAAVAIDVNAVIVDSTYNANPMVDVNNDTDANVDTDVVHESIVKPKRVRPSRAKKTSSTDAVERIIAPKKPSRASVAAASAAAALAQTSASSSSGDNVILQLNIQHKNTSESTSNFEEVFYKYAPTVDVPDAYDQQECNDYASQPFDVTKNGDEEVVVPSYMINPITKAKKKPVSAAALEKASAIDAANDKKHNRIFDHLNEFIARDEWPVSTNYVCFWCCHPFHNTPLGVPTKYIAGKFHVFGCLCSLECTSAYNFYSTETKHDVWESYNLINLLSRKISYNDVVKMAPPRHSLKMFGGYMTIEEFRAHCKSNKIINTHTFPMVAMIQQLEEVNEDDQYCNRKNMFIPVDKQKLFLLESKVKLERTKPLFTNKNTLDHAMNLRVDNRVDNRAENF